MKLIIENLSLATQLVGSQLSVATLAANVIRDNNMGINFSSLQEFLKSEGFENTISQRPLEDIPSLAMPVVVLLKNEEAAVIVSIEGYGQDRVYKIQQLDGLTQLISHQELNNGYLGYCWFIKPKIGIDSRSELPEYKLPKAWFFKVIWRFKRYYYQVILATFIINFLALVSSLYVMNVYDRVIPNQAYNTLWVLSIGVFIAISFEFIAKMIRGHLTDIAGKKADLIISSALFRRVVGLKLQERPASSGSYASNLRDFESVRDFMTSASLLTLVDLPFLFLFITVIWLVAGSLAIVPSIIIPLVIFVGFLAQGPLAKYINESMKESSQRQGLAVEAIEGLETLKTNNAAKWAQKRWDHYTATAAASSIKLKDVSNFVVNFAVAMQQLNTVFLVLYGTYLIHSEDQASKITMGALIAAVILSGRALAPVGQIAGLAVRFQQAWVALKGVNGIVERKTDRDSDRNYVTLDQVNGELQFNNVSFSYSEDGAPALSSLNLSIRPKEKVGILGRIGSGKSTALKTASGLYDLNSGTISLDGVDLRQLDPSFLRNQILLLEQNPRLFLGSLRENMDLARMDGFSTDQDLIRALTVFGLDKLIRNHPRGLDMPLGENGLGLSGGQKQVIALARMLLRNPKVVLLDEPTTALDQASEIQALRVLANWCRNRTMVIVTHRPQVLQIVDRIVIIEQGKVVMDGPRDAVLKRLAENEKNAQQQQATAEQTPQTATVTKTQANKEEVQQAAETASPRIDTTL
ncbi:type I secretion system permease/ATPase [Testudinibacter sp. TR-2022]|uniref:type I secretion system permease/ATPase n=1 Tax=Testudinibacter sp. TR-2022 TaxID=2585029 RepID=UPI00111816C6|nr:type I secretion system permease/ATPase [Testudinibacter sp. TR-2022]TNH04777.1 type I secretion system permease/ATPase [Pasteurellaceae bacterium Phil31]TNH10249.1 type I secretion system permease/ATPase [Testudinibacter sp. TR-2022]TNH12132.1 type I secretion system permease/ATPase [Testudinibacter sp. TR-2022]TNH12762.1 type I secretion system permease/ATPase [Testudinibacter sp. TR-2022]TNH18111.1 type I secretion system permease/ATPase [Testudinibacter sp. TR-2022]